MEVVMTNEIKNKIQKVQALQPRVMKLLSENRMVEFLALNEELDNIIEELYSYGLHQGIDY